MKRTITFNVAGGDLPDGFSVTLTCEVDCTGVPIEQLLDIAFSGQTARVKYQGQLRKLKPEQLLAMSMDIIKIHFNDIYSTAVAPRSSKDLMKALPKDKFVETIMDEYDFMTMEKAEALYDRTHRQ